MSYNEALVHKNLIKSMFLINRSIQYLEDRWEMSLIIVISQEI